MISRRTVICLGTAQLIAWGTSYYLIGVFGEHIAATSGWSRGFTYGGFSVGLLVMGFASAWAGRAVDRHGGLPVLASGSLLNAAGCLGLAYAHHPAVYCLAWIVLGLSMRLTLYDAAFAALARIGGAGARRAMAQITLLGGLASTTFWPLGNALIAWLGLVSLAHAQSAAFQTLPTGAAINMSIPLFKSRVVLVDLPTGRVAVGNPDVADIVVINPTQLYVLAKDIGTTNVLFWSRDNRMIGSINLEVVHDLDGLKAKLHQVLPNEPIEVHSAQRSIVLKGRASNVSVMNAAVRVAEGYLAQVQTAKKAQEFEQESASRRPDKSVGSVINLIEIAGAQQVMLEVKVAEISRTEVRRLQTKFYSIGKGASGAAT